MTGLADLLADLERDSSQASLRLLDANQYAVTLVGLPAMAQATNCWLTWTITWWSANSNYSKGNG
jgi:hypothetical protein